MVARNFARRFGVAVTLAAISVAAARAETGFLPINDLGDGLYLGQFQGGLYPGGTNDAPAAHAAAGLAHAELVVPRDALGNPSPTGKYALVSIGMSNTTGEFCSGGDTTVACTPQSFMGQAAAHPRVNRDSLAIVNGAKSGKTAAHWDSPSDADYDRVRDERLPPLGVTESQVQVAWVKVANPRPSSALPNADADAYRLVEQMGDISRALKDRYPNMQQVFFSSRIYAGYATTTLNPEPYAYESAFAVKWLVEAQIDQMSGGGIDPLAGDLSYASGAAPWITWGPYLWADGLTPRSDGLIWNQADLANDGTHPSMLGVAKVGTMLLDFFSESPFTQPWFLNAVPGDYNNDGGVDAADYVVWRRDNGTQDGYDLWRANFGQTAGAGAGASQSGDVSADAVPEASTILLAVIGFLAATCPCGPFAERTNQARDRHGSSAGGCASLRPQPPLPT